MPAGGGPPRGRPGVPFHGRAPLHRARPQVLFLPPGAGEGAAGRHRGPQGDMSPTKTNDAADKALESLRKQIDRVDDQLLRLLNERAALARKVGALKAEQDAEVY